MAKVKFLGVPSVTISINNSGSTDNWPSAYGGHVLFKYTTNKYHLYFGTDQTLWYCEHDNDIPPKGSWKQA